MKSEEIETHVGSNIQEQEKKLLIAHSLQIVGQGHNQTVAYATPNKEEQK